MIGVKTLVVLALVAITVTAAAFDGELDPEHFAGLSADSAFAVGLFASVGAVLVGYGWRPELASRVALSVRGRPQLVVDLVPGRSKVGELPSLVQRALFAIVFAIIGLGTFDNTATARIASVPAMLSEPSRAEYCQPERPDALDEAPAPAIEQPVDQAGCALVKRAFELGYKKDLGSCAPKAVKVESPKIKREREACTKRRLDEPFLHFLGRRVVETASDASPVDATTSYVGELRTRTNYLSDFLGDIRHSVTGTPHGSHHIFVNLPDPHPHSWLDRLTGHEPCTSLFADLPLWPRWTPETPPGVVFEHVLGQLLFATRFGTPAACSDYTIHWDSPADACARLAADPIAFLDGAGALAPMRAVLDRRAHQLALRALAADLGHPATLPEPPPARFVVSTACFVIGDQAASRPIGRDILLEGEPIAMRELHTTAIRPTGAGPVDVYLQLALLLGGSPYAGPARATRDRTSREPPGALDVADFPLLRLEPLASADPFTGERGVLDQPELLEVYPIELHLFAFVDAFRRAYLPQRGRL